MQRGGDVLRADAGQLAELPYGDLPVADLMEALQHHAAPVGHVGEPSEVRQRLLRGARLAFTLGQQVACRVWGVVGRAHTQQHEPVILGALVNTFNGDQQSGCV